MIKIFFFFFLNLFDLQSFTDFTRRKIEAETVLSSFNREQVNPNFFYGRDYFSISSGIKKNQGFSLLNVNSTNTQFFVSKMEICEFHEKFFHFIDFEIGDDFETFLSIYRLAFFYLKNFIFEFGLYANSININKKYKLDSIGKDLYWWFNFENHPEKINANLSFPWQSKNNNSKYKISFILKDFDGIFGGLNCCFNSRVTYINEFSSFFLNSDVFLNSSSRIRLSLDFIQSYSLNSPISLKLFCLFNNFFSIVEISNPFLISSTLIPKKLKVFFSCENLERVQILNSIFRFFNFEISDLFFFNILSRYNFQNRFLNSIYFDCRLPFVTQSMIEYTSFLKSQFNFDILISRAMNLLFNIDLDFTKMSKITDFSNTFHNFNIYSLNVFSIGMTQIDLGAFYSFDDKFFCFDPMLSFLHENFNLFCRWIFKYENSASNSFGLQTMFNLFRHNFMIMKTEFTTTKINKFKTELKSYLLPVRNMCWHFIFKKKDKDKDKEFVKGVLIKFIYSRINLDLGFCHKKRFGCVFNFSGDHKYFSLKACFNTNMFGNYFKQDFNPNKDSDLHWSLEIKFNLLTILKW